jgi:hypothetical protein
MPPVKLLREEFEKRYRRRFADPVFNPHRALDDDRAFQRQVLNVARALRYGVELSLAGKLQNPGERLVDPDPK